MPVLRSIQLIEVTLQRATRFRAISFHWGFIASLHSMPRSKSFIMLCSHSTPYFKVNSKSNHLAIVNNTIYQSICRYILVHTNCLSHIIIIYFSTQLKILQQELQIKITDETSNNDFPCQPNIFCLGQWLVSLINLPSLPVFVEWFTLECSNFVSFL